MYVYMLYIVYCILYIVYCILYIVYCILYIVYCILYIVYCILYIVYCILYIVYCILCISSSNSMHSTTLFRHNMECACNSNALAAISDKLRQICGALHSTTVQPAVQSVSRPSAGHVCLDDQVNLHITPRSLC